MENNKEKEPRIIEKGVKRSRLMQGSQVDVASSQCLAEEAFAIVMDHRFMSYKNKATLGIPNGDYFMHLQEFCRRSTLVVQHNAIPDPEDDPIELAHELDRIHDVRQDLVAITQKSMEWRSQDGLGFLNRAAWKKWGRWKHESQKMLSWGG